VSVAVREGLGRQVSGVGAMGLPQLWQYFHKMDGNVCLQWTVPHPARPDNQFKQVSCAAAACACAPRLSAAAARGMGGEQEGPAAQLGVLRVELSSAVSALTQPARPRVARPVHEQRLRGRAKGPLLQLWLRQERGAGASRPPLPSSLALTAAVRGCRPRTALAGRAATPRARVCPLTLRGCAQLKFSAYVKSANPFAPPATEDPVVHLA